MSTCQWSDACSVGVASIDEQHQRIFELANALHVAQLRGDVNDTAIMIVIELSAYIAEHFAHEEECMRAVGYPGLAEHVRVHEELAAKVEQMSDELQDGLVRVAEVHDLLVEWVHRHIMEEDHAYAPYMASLEKGPAAPAGGSAPPPAGDDSELYRWNERFSVGVPAVDDQHKRIFDLAHAMHVALLTGEGRDTAERIIIELSAYIEGHFADEEARMREAAYPGLAAHVEIHRKMAVKVDDLLQKLRDRRVHIAEVHRFVVMWLMKHILETDMDYRPYLVRQDAA